MAAIDQYLRQILEATYGEEVRHSIHDAIQQNYMDVSDSVRQANEAAEAAEGAVAQANQATANVNAVVSAANQASSTANEASQRATSAASRVETIEQKYANATATATQLAEGATPTASLTDGPNGKIFAFGIPKGRTGDKGETGATGATGAKGDTGATPQLSIGTVAKGDDAAATITGTAENPVLNLTLPKGDKGDTGATGGKGDKGDTGATGQTGPQGPTGATPRLSVGTVSTGLPGSQASVTITGTTEEPVLNFAIPKGDTGIAENIYGNTVPMSEQDSTTVAQAIANATDADAVHSVNGKSATNHAVTVNADDIKMSADDATNIPNKLKQYVKTVNGTPPDPITGNVTVATGGGDASVGLIRRVIGIAVSDWAGSGPFTYTYQDADIKVGMVVLEDTLSDEYAQLGINTYTVQNGSLTIATTVKPTTDWSLDIALGMDGSSILDDVGDLQNKVGTSTLTTTAQNLSDAVNELDDDLSNQSQQIGNMREAMTYVVDGNKSTITIPVGAYFQLVNSQITGRSDGVYTASQAIPANTTIDSTYFTQTEPISGGAVNVLNNKLAYSTIDVNNYSTFADIYNVLTTPGMIGIGAIGNYSTANLKTILPNPGGFANYTSVSITVIGNSIMQALAIQYAVAKIAHCFIYYDNGSWHRTDWAIRTEIT